MMEVSSILWDCNLTLGTLLIQYSCHFDAFPTGHSPAVALLLAARISPSPAVAHVSVRTCAGQYILPFVKAGR